MSRTKMAVVAALASTLACGVALPTFADNGGNTNSPTNAATQRNDRLPSDASAAGSRPVTSGSGAPVTTGTKNSFSATSTDNMNGWASDYATRNRGRVSRQAYMDEMGRRWDTADRGGQGLTPAEVSRLYGNVDSAAPPAMTGSGVQPGNMGPGNAKGK
jgi:hypothetical protein